MSNGLDRYETCIDVMSFPTPGFITPRENYVIIESDEKKGMRISTVNTKLGPLSDLKIGLEAVIKPKLKLAV